MLVGELVELPPAEPLDVRGRIVEQVPELAQAFGIADVSDIGQINLLNYLWPVWMVVLGILLLGNRPKALLAVFGILIGHAG